MNLNELLVLAVAAGVDVGRLHKPFTSKEPRRLVDADFNAMSAAEAKRNRRIKRNKGTTYDA